MTYKTGSINEIQVSDTDPSTDIDDNDCIGWRSIPEIAASSEDCDMDRTEWLDFILYEQDHMISSLEYAKLKLASFAVKPLISEPVIVLPNTWATCSCISHHLFMKISKITLHINLYK